MRKPDESTWQAQCVIAEDIPQSYKDHMLQDLEYEVSRKLWHSLQGVSNPCVVEMFNEERDEYLHSYDNPLGRPVRRFRMGYHLTSVQYRHVVLPETMPCSTHYQASESKHYNWFQKLWQRWTKSIWLI